MAAAARVFRGCRFLMAAAGGKRPASASASASAAGAKVTKTEAALAKEKRGIMQPVPVSDALSRFADGAPEMSRAGAVKLIWNHIKANGLQVSAPDSPTASSPSLFTCSFCSSRGSRCSQRSLWDLLAVRCDLYFVGLGFGSHGVQVSLALAKEYLLHTVAPILVRVLFWEGESHLGGFGSSIDFVGFGSSSIDLGEGNPISADLVTASWWLDTVLPHFGGIGYNFICEICATVKGFARAIYWIY